MPAHISEKHFNTGETVEIGGVPYIKGDSIVYLDSKDGLHKRYIMYESALVLQYWDGTKWENV